MLNKNAKNMKVKYIITDYIDNLLSLAEYDKLEDWILVGIKFGHTLPVIGKINLNKKPTHASFGTL